MKIAIVVHGRFHGFDLARELLRRGHEVVVFTNYPGWAAERFGIPRRHIRSYLAHGVVSRMAWTSNQKAGVPYPEAWIHTLFGRWAAGQLRKEEWDVVHLWSGVAEEALRYRAGGKALHLLARGSAHIRTQARILEEEEARVGARLDRPSRWMVAREEREYTLAERIVVLSTFARQSFVDEGVSERKLALLPLGARLEDFRPPPQIIEERCARILTGQPLRVLFVGTQCYRKGMQDISEILRSIDPSRYKFRFVGPPTEEVAGLIQELHGRAEFVPKQPQHELSRWYTWGDVFIFPTLEDGYAVVLAQAAAAGLPILATTNCSGPDLIRHGETGWVLPIRRPDAFVEHLQWCDDNRPRLATMARRIYDEFQPRDWSDVAADFERICTEQIHNAQGQG